MCRDSKFAWGVLYFLVLKMMSIQAQHIQTTTVMDSLDVVVRSASNPCEKARQMALLAEEWAVIHIPTARKTLSEAKSIAAQNACEEASCWVMLGEARLYLRASAPDSAAMTLEHVQSKARGLGNMDMEMAIRRRLAAFLMRTGKWEEARQQFIQAEELAKSQRNKRELFLVKMGKASFFMEQSDIDAALRESRFIVDSLADAAPEKLSEVYATLGRCYSDLGEIEKGISAYHNAIEYARKYRIENNGSWLARSIGILYSQVGNWAEAESMFNASLTKAEKQGNAVNAALALEALAGLKSENGQHEASETLLKQALDKLKNEKNPVNSITILCNLGEVQVKLGKKAEANKNLLDALALAKQFQITAYQVAALSSLGNLAYTEGQNAKALRYFKEGETLLDETDVSEIRLSFLSKLSETSAALGDYASAYRYQQKFNAFRDSIFSKERISNLNKLEATFKSREKDQEIALNQAKIAAQTAVIGRQRAWAIAFAIGLLLTGILAWTLYKSSRRFRLFNKELRREKRKSDELLLNILPAEVAEELKRFNRAQAQRFENVTVLCTDFKDFTGIAERMSPESLVALIDEYFRAFDEITARYGIEKIKTIGDAYLCAGGLPDPDKGEPLAVVRAALEIRTTVENIKREKEKNNLPFFECRIGIHSGPVVAGIVGLHKFQYDIWGDTVNVATRMEQNGEVGKINISSSVYSAVQDVVRATYRGEIQVKGKGNISMYFLDEVL